MKFQKLLFKNQKGEKLAARLDLPPDEQPIAFALFAHCFTCTKNLIAASHISSALNREGIAVLRFDFTGLGESEGDFEDTNFSSNVEDLVAAADFLKEEYEAPKILIGHSLGGTAVLQAAAKIPSSKAVATIAAPAEPSRLISLIGDIEEKVEAEGVAEITLAGRKFRIKKQFLDDLKQNRMEKAIRNLKKALIIFHSPADKIVDIENAADIFKAAKHPKSFVSLDQADHLLMNKEDSLYVGSVIAAWARKYIEIPQPDEKAFPENMVIARIGREGFQTDIIANGHHLTADEPVAAGGTDTGPSPYDFLVAGLGACTAMTLRMYADRKEWPLDSVVVRLRHEKIHAEDCKGCETETGKVDQVEREIEVFGSLSKEQRERLVEIANKCPVHRTLHSEVNVKTKLKES